MNPLRPTKGRKARLMPDRLSICPDCGSLDPAKAAMSMGGHAYSAPWKPDLCLNEFHLQPAPPDRPSSTDVAREVSRLQELLNTHGSDRPRLAAEHTAALRVLLADYEARGEALARADELESSGGGSVNECTEQQAKADERGAKQERQWRDSETAHPEVEEAPHQADMALSESSLIALREADELVDAIKPLPRNHIWAQHTREVIKNKADAYQSARAHTPTDTGEARVEPSVPDEQSARLSLGLARPDCANHAEGKAATVDRGIGEPAPSLIALAEALEARAAKAEREDEEVPALDSSDAWAIYGMIQGLREAAQLARAHTPTDTEEA